MCGGGGGGDGPVGDVCFAGCLPNLRQNLSAILLPLPLLRQLMIMILDGDDARASLLLSRCIMASPPAAGRCSACSTVAVFIIPFVGERMERIIPANSITVIVTVVDNVDAVLLLLQLTIPTRRIPKSYLLFTCYKIIIITTNVGGDWSVHFQLFSAMVILFLWKLRR